jgi:hypothetical protein
MPGGSEVRTLDAGRGIWLIVSTVPAAEYGEAAVGKGLRNLDWVGRRAMAHEAVVEHFLTAPALLPMQLFTLFTSDERALAHVARDRARIDRILRRLDRQHEWGLRLTFDEGAARVATETRYRHGGRHRASTLSGTTYLARKRDLLDVTRAQLVRARAQSDRLYRTMRREATHASRRTALERAAPGSRLLLDAAFLVPRARAGAFRAALKKNIKSLDTVGIVVSLTGPWPAYNFVQSSKGQATTVKRSGRQR